jgi:hypothetical protein
LVCICVLFVSFAGFVFIVVESVVVSVGRISVVAVVVVEDDDGFVVEIDDDDEFGVEISKALCDTGSTIGIGFLARFSLCPVGGAAAYTFVCCIFCGIEG